MNALREKIAIALALRFEFPDVWAELSDGVKNMHRDTADVVMPIVREAVRETADYMADMVASCLKESDIDAIVKRICE